MSNFLDDFIDKLEKSCNENYLKDLDELCEPVKKKKPKSRSELMIECIDEFMTALELGSPSGQLYRKWAKKFQSENHTDLVCLINNSESFNDLSVTVKQLGQKLASPDPIDCEEDKGDKTSEVNDESHEGQIVIDYSQSEYRRIYIWQTKLFRSIPKWAWIALALMYAAAIIMEILNS